MISPQRKTYFTFGTKVHSWAGIWEFLSFRYTLCLPKTGLTSAAPQGLLFYLFFNCVPLETTLACARASSKRQMGTKSVLMANAALTTSTCKAAEVENLHISGSISLEGTVLGKWARANTTVPSAHAGTPCLSHWAGIPYFMKRANLSDRKNLAI